MSILQAIILGIVQGLCEFLPVSSSGHLVLLQTMFGIEEGAMFFDIMLHVGTLFAVCLVYRETLMKMIKNPTGRLPVLLVIATIPAVIFTLIFNDFIDEMFSVRFVGVGLLITAVLLFLSDNIARGQRGIKEVRTSDALAMGIMQGIAIIPGISRSGSTISVGLFAGLDRRFAADFAFLMSVPAILGSLVLGIVKVTKEGLGQISIMPIIIGTIVAGISGYAAIKIMLRVIKKDKLKYFSIYVAIVGILVLIDQHITHYFF